MKNGKKYFPNKWKEFKDAPDEMFCGPDGEPLAFEEFMDWKVHNWIIHPHFYAIVRVRNTRTDKVSEYSYKQPKSFVNKLMQLKESKDDLEITASTDYMVSTLYSKDLSDYDFDV